MRNRVLVGTLLILVAVLTVTLVPSSPTVHAAGNPTLGVWDPNHKTNKIIDDGLGPGSTFTIDVNVTNAGPISGFDVTLRYEISPYFVPPPITTSASDVDVSTGLFNGATCGVTPVVQSVYPTEFYIRESFVTNGCSVDGTNGVLFSVRFTVLTTGTTTFNIPQTSAGTQSQLIVSFPPSGTRLPGLQVVDGSFENLPGNPAPPVPNLDYSPNNPFIGTTITFNATNSFDPGNPTGASNGITQVIWTFGDSSSPIKGTMLAYGVTKHLFLQGPTTPAQGYYPVTLVVVGSNANLPARADAIVYINAGKNHDLAISIGAGVTSARVGDTVQFRVTVANRGNQNDTAALTVSYFYQNANQTIGQEPNLSVPAGSPIKQFQYSMQTTDLIPEVFTVTATLQLLGTNVTDKNPADNTAQVSFTLLSSSQTANNSILSTPVLAVGGIVALAAILGGVQLLRRRRRLAEEREDKLA